MEIAVNKCFGGFSPSMRAYREYLKLKGKKSFFYKQTKFDFKDEKEEHTRIDNIDKKESGLFSCYSKDFGKKTNKLDGRYFVYLRDDKLRIDKDFIKVVKKLKKKVNTSVSDIKIIKIPDGIDWEIDNYGGVESIHKEHRSW